MNPYVLASVLADQRIAELRAEQRRTAGRRHGRPLRAAAALTTAARGAVTAGITAAGTRGRAAAGRRPA